MAIPTSMTATSASTAEANDWMGLNSATAARAPVAAIIAHACFMAINTSIITTSAAAAQAHGRMGLDSATATATAAAA